MSPGAMQKAHLALLALHVFSLLFWVGSLVSITRVMAAAEGETDAVRARLAATARKIYRAVASPWMGVATLTGFGMIGVMHGAYFRFGWFHGKFTVALAMLALHFVLGSRVRGAEANGLTDEAAKGARALQLGVLVCAALAVLFVIVLKNLHAST
jgi:protoporphyrinogen IX oxidase